MFLRSACCAGALALGLCLGGCADTMTAGQPMKRFTDLVRSYDDTLTSSQRDEAISELQKDKERQQKVIEQGDGGPKAN